MLVIEDGKIYNDDNVWVQNIVKDSKTGLSYEILWDDIGLDVYVLSTIDNPILLELVDIITNITYQMFVHDGRVFVVPIKNSLGRIIYGKECFMSSGATALLNIERNSTEIATVSDIEIKILDKDTEEFLFIDTILTQIKENLFKVEFILPFKGTFLIIIKVMGNMYLNKEITTYQYTYSELIRELVIIEEELNKDKFIGYI